MKQVLSLPLIPFALIMTGLLSALGKYDLEWKIATKYGIYGDDMGTFPYEPSEGDRWLVVYPLLALLVTLGIFAVAVGVLLVVAA